MTASQHLTISFEPQAAEWCIAYKLSTITPLFCKGFYFVRGQNHITRWGISTLFKKLEFNRIKNTHGNSAENIHKFSYLLFGIEQFLNFGFSILLEIFK